jgi:hypothetical protein
MFPGAPLLLSYPHFYDADAEYAKQIDGMKPTKEEHTSYMIIEPVSKIRLTLYECERNLIKV